MAGGAEDHKLKRDLLRVQVSNRSALRAVLREPLLHFIVLATLLFALNAWLAPATSSVKGEIKVSSARMVSLAENFRRTWQRPPTQQEMDGLIADFLREEVLVREALALGLDRDDTIVRRRLRQKMEFISEEAAGLLQATDQELADYVKAHPDAFRSEPVFTFTQVYLDPAKRGKAVESDARRLLSTLQQTRTADTATLGDRLTLLESRYEAMQQRDMTKLFGKDFADALINQPIGRWSGPIASGYGLHLVNVESATRSASPTLEQVRPLAEREWRNAKRKEVAAALYERLSKQYRIVIDKPGAPPK